jgi:hypothetical protein
MLQDTREEKVVVERRTCVGFTWKWDVSKGNNGGELEAQ